jgi:hypothetical protein
MTIYALCNQIRKLTNVKMKIQIKRFNMKSKYICLVLFLSQNYLIKSDCVKNDENKRCASKPAIDSSNPYYVYDMDNNKYNQVPYNWLPKKGKKLLFSKLSDKLPLDFQKEIDANNGQKYFGNIKCETKTDKQGVRTRVCSPDTICQNEFFGKSCLTPEPDCEFPQKNPLAICILNSLDNCLKEGHLPTVRVNKPTTGITEVYLQKGQSISGQPFNYTDCDSSYNLGLFGLLNIITDSSDDIGCPFKALRNATATDNKNTSISLDKVIDNIQENLLSTYYKNILDCLLTPITDDNSDYNKKQNGTGLVDRQIVFQNDPSKPFVCQQLNGNEVSGTNYTYVSRTKITNDDDDTGLYKNVDLLIAGQNACVRSPDAKVCIGCNGANISCPNGITIIQAGTDKACSGDDWDKGNILDLSGNKFTNNCDSKDADYEICVLTTACETAEGDEDE